MASTTEHLDDIEESIDAASGLVSELSPQEDGNSLLERIEWLQKEKRMRRLLRQEKRALMKKEAQLQNVMT